VSHEKGRKGRKGLKGMKLTKVKSVELELELVRRAIGRRAAEMERLMDIVEGMRKKQEGTIKELDRLVRRKEGGKG
jgi:hypothetical protein